MDELLVLGIDALIVGAVTYFYKQAGKKLDNVQVNNLKILFLTFV